MPAVQATRSAIAQTRRARPFGAPFGVASVPTRMCLLSLTDAASHTSERGRAYGQRGPMVGPVLATAPDAAEC